MSLVICRIFNFEVSTNIKSNISPYEVNGKLVIGNGSLTPICSFSTFSNRSLLPSLTAIFFLFLLTKKGNSTNIKSNISPYEVNGKLVIGNGSLIPICPSQIVPYCQV